MRRSSSCPAASRSRTPRVCSAATSTGAPGGGPRERRLHDFAGFGIDAGLLEAAADDAVVLHCLPAHIGEEISGDVLYGGQSAVWQQAENRLHVQKALLTLLLS